MRNANWGGARPGSGRKTKGDKRQTFSFSLPPSLVQRLDEGIESMPVTESGKSLTRSQALEQIIESYLRGDSNS